MVYLHVEDTTVVAFKARQKLKSVTRVETWLALRREDRENLDDLKRLQFRAIDGRPVTLGDVATFTVVERPREIQREARKVRVAVQATYEGEDWEAADVPARSV